ncbi:MAG: hypothetical protein WCG23_07045 [bacterium]
MLKNSDSINNETEKSKKFVFQLYDENIDFVESLSYQEKNDILNQLLNDYRLSNIYGKKLVKKASNIKKSVIIFFAVIIGIPLILYLISLSLNLTKSSYTQMQNNFSKLF